MQTSGLILTSYGPSREYSGGCIGADAFGAGLAAGRVRAVLLAWTTRRERRRAALTIDDRTLADIGWSRSLVTQESAKPFWRA